MTALRRQKRPPWASARPLLLSCGAARLCVAAAAPSLLPGLLPPQYGIDGV